MRKKTNNEFIQEVYELVGDEYKFNEEYLDSSTKIEVTHNKCGNVYKVSPNSFLRGRRCPNCFGNKSKTKTTPEFKKEVYRLVGDEYTVLGNYINRSTDVLIRHNSCNSVYKVRPGNFLCGHRCIECYYDSLRRSDAYIQDKIKKSIGDQYIFIKRVVKNIVIIKHLTCGNYYTARLNDVYLGKSSCKKCNSSLGEQLVREYLVNKKFKFKEQVTFEDLVDKNKLSYDFMVIDKNILIEYQGKQHYTPTMFRYKDKKYAINRFKIQVKHDNMKREYAFRNGYQLIEIPYSINTPNKISDYLDNLI